MYNIGTRPAMIQHGVLAKESCSNIITYISCYITYETNIESHFDIHNEHGSRIALKVLIGILGIANALEFCTTIQLRNAVYDIGPNVVLGFTGERPIIATEEDDRSHCGILCTSRFS